MATCTSCGANWSQGAFDKDCPECGGGAMDIPCPVCNGHCGARWQRAVTDSQDASLAHWFGGCALMAPRQGRLKRLASALLARLLGGTRDFIDGGQLATRGRLSIVDARDGTVFAMMAAQPQGLTLRQ